MQHLGFTRLGNSQGYPLAIIHGWGCDSSFLLPLAKMFPERDLYLIDLPGYGRSAALAPIASDLSATIYYLINTIPHGADVISWSFGTLYVLRALSSINNPCVNLESLAQSVLATPVVKALTAPPGSKSQGSTSQGTRPHCIEHYRIEAQSKGLSSQLQAEATTDDCGARAAALTQLAYDDAIERTSLLAHQLCHPDAQPFVRSLVTICGSPRFPSDPNWQGLSPVKILKCNTEMTPKRLTRLVHLFYRLMIDERNACPLEREYIHSLIKNTPEVPPEVLMAGIKLVTFLDERPALEHLNLPSLHLFGAQDHLVPYELAQQFSGDPIHHAYVFQHSGHNPYLSEPELFEQVVRTFYHHVEQGKVVTFRSFNATPSLRPSA